MVKSVSPCHFSPLSVNFVWPSQRLCRLFQTKSCDIDTTIICLSAAAATTTTETDWSISQGTDMRQTRKSKNGGRKDWSRPGIHFCCYCCCCCWPLAPAFSATISGKKQSRSQKLISAFLRVPNTQIKVYVRVSSKNTRALLSHSFECIFVCLCLPENF